MNPIDKLKTNCAQYVKTKTDKHYIASGLCASCYCKKYNNGKFMLLYYDKNSLIMCPSCCKGVFHRKMIKARIKRNKQMDSLEGFTRSPLNP